MRAQSKDQTVKPVVHLFENGPGQSADGSVGVLQFICPACHGSRHQVPVVIVGPGLLQAAPGSHVWGWNGSVESPTITPSLRCMGQDPITKAMTVTTCHNIVTDGRIHFCSDSPHSMAGQTVPLPPFE